MAMSAFTQWLTNPSKNWFTAQHCKALSRRLRKYADAGEGGSNGVVLCEGLRYDDLYDPMYDLDIKEALARLPREIVDARNQRLKRAMDLSMKHEYLHENLQVGLPLCVLLPIGHRWVHAYRDALGICPAALAEQHLLCEGKTVVCRSRTGP
ncbi:hypothetical protein Taro_052952 [Colocasia esculenta]|uniref:Cytochrome b-c1 complex subunit 7 n=1 Tax=Colocasia esculenta TaxID=4460 RepID=A0A843XJZ3_COLES|nr:hypothetical protein [Colocasia esculenta]